MRPTIHTIHYTNCIYTTHCTLQLTQVPTIPAKAMFTPGLHLLTPTIHTTHYIHYTLYPKYTTYCTPVPLKPAPQKTFTPELHLLRTTATPKPQHLPTKTWHPSPISISSSLGSNTHSTLLTVLSDPIHNWHPSGVITIIHHKVGDQRCIWPHFYYKVNTNASPPVLFSTHTSYLTGHWYR